MWRAIVLATAVYLFLASGTISVNNVWAGQGQWGGSSGHGMADFNGDCEINIFDMQMIAWRYGSWLNHGPYDTRYDLDPFMATGQYDYDIDIKDIQRVFVRSGLTCLMFWDPQTSMGMYSYKGSTPTGPGTACCPTAKTPPGSAYYVDPISMVFTNNAFSSRLEQELTTHGLPVLEYDGEQRFWEVGQCSFEDVDAGENGGGCCPIGCPNFCPEPDAWERFHIRAEVGAESYQTQWGPFGGHVTLGTFAVGTPHFDDDDETCNFGGLIPGHFVPEVFPYPERIYPGFQGSGFDAGREWLIRQLGGSYSVEYWGNRTPIHQACGDDQDPASNGWVVFKAIN